MEQKKVNMYKTQKTFIIPGMKMLDLIEENPYLLLMLEHFNIDFTVKDKTVHQLFSEKAFGLPISLAICNLYNGFTPSGIEEFNHKDISTIITFLQNSHSYYKQIKYPEIIEYIKQLYNNNVDGEIKLIEKFFSDYFEEVKEHLDYEEQLAFPYFTQLTNRHTDKNTGNEIQYSSKEYFEHHSDIQSKLEDLKSLLLKHITLNNQLSVRRKLLFSLFELEFDLKIHSLIEETILIPLINRMEIEN